MVSTVFNTDLFRDITFDLLSGIANDPSKFDELVQNYLTKLHERTDGEELRKYTRDIYEKILSKIDLKAREMIFGTVWFRFTNGSIEPRFSIERYISRENRFALYLDIFGYSFGTDAIENHGH